VFGFEEGLLASDIEDDRFLYQIFCEIIDILCGPSKEIRRAPLEEGESLEAMGLAFVRAMVNLDAVPLLAKARQDWRHLKIKRYY